MAGIKNFNLSGVASDLQFGKRGGRMVFDEQEKIFKFVMADGTTSAHAEMQDLTINGNLTVLGDTTTINVETVTVQDNVIELNSGEEGAGVSKGTAGIEINRGTEQNARIVWDEDSDTFKFQLADGTPVSVEGDFVVPDVESLYRLSDGKVVFDTSGATSDSAEYVQLSTEAGRAILSAKNEEGTGDVDLVLTGQGNGTVIFTSETGTADGILTSQNGTDLLISGGDEDSAGEVGSVTITGGNGTESSGGDVVLSGGSNGGTVRIDTTVTVVDDTSADDTVATVGYVKSKSTDLSDALGVLEGRVDGIDGTLVTVDGRLETIDGTLVTVGTRLDTIDGQVVDINGQLEALETQIGEVDTTFIAATDTPEAYGTAGQYVVINEEGDGLVFADLPEFSTTILELSDTPEAYGETGQVLAINETGDGIEYIDLPSSIMEFTDTPAEMGTAGQVLIVSEDGTTLEFGMIEPPESVLELGDTPEEYGTPGQVLAVNATADGMEFIDTRTLSAIELSGMSSSTASIDATSGAYATIAEPVAYTDSDGTTTGITVNRITVRVGSTLDAGEGLRVIVENDVDNSEAAVIAEADLTDVEAGVYVIDGIFQNVTMSPLQRVRAALVDENGDVVAASSGTISVFVEYKTNIQ